ncbi:CsgG/HfaB family protein [Novosphingobium sp. PASSN1]|uniref:CsgG/HfaB family protein n=1 Tax=Novosphingobium sp. PASSN1 TaxID=2015561 RepID=UPI000BD4295A|nr:CsgG/HfaB family protein [Novosphingobium sp. PASSN1]OYU34935.1 MAG: hypothetical protein CFE35_13735 [Novosphingobium sp. PASSN1]
MFNAPRGKRAFAAGIMMLASSTLASCVSTIMPRAIKTQTVMNGERPVVLGSTVRANYTPMEAPLACLARGLNLARRRPLVIGVGEIKDYTGRYSINEGNVVTQGGALMLYSALAKLGGTVRVAERYDPGIGERELAYTDRRQLGNGAPQLVDGKSVPWVPYFGGTIQGSDYYIVGGITEANANIASGGAEIAVNNIGAKRRTFTQSVAIDLRIVDSRSLLVVDAVSLQKQFTGYEVGANTFRFFGLDLFDVTIGAKAQEPMQLGIRATIEEAAIILVGRVNQMDVSPCLQLIGTRLPTRTSEQFFREAVSGKAPEISKAASRIAGLPNGAPAELAKAPPPARSMTDHAAPQTSHAADKPLNQIAASGNADGSEMVVLTFEVNEVNLPGAAAAMLDRIVAMARNDGVTVSLTTRDSESTFPAQRTRLLDARLAGLIAALATRGIPMAAITVEWRPDNADSTVYRQGAGLQALARIKIKT